MINFDAERGYPYLESIFGRWTSNAEKGRDPLFGPLELQVGPFCRSHTTLEAIPTLNFNVTDPSLPFKSLPSAGRITQTPTPTSFKGSQPTLELQLSPSASQLS